MKKGTKKVLVAVGALGAVGLLGAIIFWPKKASAATTETKLPVALDDVLSEGQKKDVARLLYNENDPSVLAKAGSKYFAMGAPIAGDLLFGKVASMLKPALDSNLTDAELKEIAVALFVWTNPIEIQTAGLALQSRGYPMAAAAVMQRALNLSKLAA